MTLESPSSVATQRIETIEDYLSRHVGEMWRPENSAHVLDHIRQVEATWAAICARGGGA